MSIDVFSLRCGALEGATLAGFKGVEGLSLSFEFDVFFTVPVGTDVRGAVEGACDAGRRCAVRRDAHPRGGEQWMPCQPK